MSRDQNKQYYTILVTKHGFWDQKKQYFIILVAFYDANVVIPYAITTFRTKKAILAYTCHKRWYREGSGTWVAGNQVYSKRSQNPICQRHVWGKRAINH